MPGHGGLIVGVCAAALVLLDVLVVKTLIAAGWNTVARARRAEPVGDGAVRRRYQSFSFGVFNFGCSVHVAADERYLHLTPAGFMRWAGPRPVSIPWEEVRLAEKQPRRASLARAKIGKTTVVGPRWALELAGPASGVA